jgi:hypothetical protein
MSFIVEKASDSVNNCDVNHSDFAGRVSELVFSIRRAQGEKYETRKSRYDIALLSIFLCPCK